MLLSQYHYSPIHK